MMTEAEARQILGVSENSTWEEISQVFPSFSIIDIIVGQEFFKFGCVI